VSRPGIRESRRERSARLAGRKPRILLDDFETLLADFSDHILAARKLRVTDPKHDAVIRTALRGFSLTSKVFKWDAAHFLYVQRRGRQHYAAMGDGAMLFFALAAGYALGLAREDEVTKTEFRAAESHLDGVIRLNLGKINAAFLAGMK
jgi:hypothetical protein